MHEALALVRRELGPQAAVLHTREVNGSLPWRLIPGLRKIEVTAAADVNVPSRLPTKPPELPRMPPGEAPARAASAGAQQPAADRNSFSVEVQGQLAELQSMVEELSRRWRHTGREELPKGLFQLYTELIDAEIQEELARDLVERVKSAAPSAEWDDPGRLKERIAGQLEEELRVAGPLQLAAGRCRVVALVGPTGVGKTTTIAKLAANYRLRDKRKVGLITVDTYRIAAVEQLRTYADIIDLPMQVVCTPKEMRQAVAEMAEMDLVLLDTAGRSPKDDVRIQELRAFLTEAGAAEVHLVLSSVASAGTLQKTAERFMDVGASALVLTKLDEAAGLGNVLPLLRTSRLPISYVTNGQNVPDDIAAADARRLARLVLGLDGATAR